MTTALAQATAVLRECGMRHLVVTEIRAMHGGMVSPVEEWITTGSPASVVCKRTEHPDDPALRHEWLSLRWVRENTQFPVPQTYGYISGEPGGGTCLVMERPTGRNLGEARLTPAGVDSVHAQLADHLARLHSHHRETYGLVAEEEEAHAWLDWFAPRFRSNYDDARSALSADSRRTIERLLAELPEWLPESHSPTLLHGDLWATNIIVDDGDPDRPRLTGFIDGGGLFADVEYELAYLLVFGMVDERFFRLYTERHPLREGFARRCRVYWLNTMLLHLWLFGTDYLGRTERLSAEIAQMME